METKKEKEAYDNIVNNLEYIKAETIRKWNKLTDTNKWFILSQTSNLVKWVDNAKED